MSAAAESSSSDSGSDDDRRQESARRTSSRVAPPPARVTRHAAAAPPPTRSAGGGGAYRALSPPRSFVAPRPVSSLVLLSGSAAATSTDRVVGGGGAIGTADRLKYRRPFAAGLLNRTRAPQSMGVVYADGYVSTYSYDTPEFGLPPASASATATTAAGGAVPPMTDARTGQPVASIRLPASAAPATSAILRASTIAGNLPPVTRALEAIHLPAITDEIRSLAAVDPTGERVAEFERHLRERAHALNEVERFMCTAPPLASKSDKNEKPTASDSSLPPELSKVEFPTALRTLIHDFECMYDLKSLYHAAETATGADSIPPEPIAIRGTGSGAATRLTALPRVDLEFWDRVIQFDPNFAITAKHTKAKPSASSSAAAMSDHGNGSLQSHSQSHAFNDLCTCMDCRLELQSNYLRRLRELQNTRLAGSKPEYAPSAEERAIAVRFERSVRSIVSQLPPHALVSMSGTRLATRLFTPQTLKIRKPLKPAPASALATASEPTLSDSVSPPVLASISSSSPTPPDTSSLVLKLSRPATAAPAAAVPAATPASLPAEAVPAATPASLPATASAIATGNASTLKIRINKPPAPATPTTPAAAASTPSKSAAKQSVKPSAAASTGDSTPTEGGKRKRKPSSIALTAADDEAVAKLLAEDSAANKRNRRPSVKKRDDDDDDE